MPADDKLYDWNGSAPPGKFDVAKAAALIGKSILIGISYLNEEGEEETRVSTHGVIQTATPEGVRVALKGEREGQSWNMPPNLDVISPIEPGIYRLGEGAEAVENPDFVVIWSIAKPRQKPAGA
mgnify:CR=1 FL=1